MLIIDVFIHTKIKHNNNINYLVMMLYILNKEHDSILYEFVIKLTKNSNIDCCFCNNLIHAQIVYIGKLEITIYPCTVLNIYVMFVIVQN